MDHKLPSPRSRYGRNQKSKVSQDFYSLDHIDLESDARKRRQKSPPPVAHNLSTRAPDPGKRKFFKRAGEKADVVIDVDKVLKIISPHAVGVEKGAKTTSIRTYSNKRKQCTNGLVESFGLPDEPIPSVESPKLARNRKIDVNQVTPPNQINIDLIFDQKLPEIAEIKEEVIEENEERPKNGFKSQLKVVLTPLKLHDELKSEVKEELETTPKKDGKRRLRSSFISKEVDKRKIENGSLGKQENDGIEENVEVKKEIVDFEIGNLAWAKIGCHPYWPCLITPEPDTGIHKRLLLKRRQILYHVRFFGDCGRRSWVQANSMLPYENKNDLDKLHLQNMKPNKLKKWQRGVDEAELVKLKAVNEKLDFFSLFLKRDHKKKIKVEKIKMESNYESDDEEKFWKRKISLTKTDDSVEKRITRSWLIDDSKTKIDGQFTEKEETETLATIKKEMDEKNEYYTKLRKRTTFNGTTVNDIEPVRKADDKKRKNEELDSKKSGESDTDSKFSENSFPPMSVESQIQLFKRNNIFRGISKEKVCQICEKLTGTIVQCTGPCNGNYHSECAQNKITQIEYKNLSLSEKIDYKMKEIMQHCQTVTYEDGDETKCVKHVTADSVIIDYALPDLNEFKCKWCINGKDPPCFICKLETKMRQKCSLNKCGKFYHLDCLKMWWPQTQWSLKTDTFVCPRHVCHTCVSDNPAAAAASMRCTSDKVVKCLKCPATYHSTSFCVPAGCDLLTTTQIVCPRHGFDGRKRTSTINTNWCFICGNGGNLTCCETCPTSVHDDCLPIVNDLFNGDFYCEDCQSGRLPLYDEIVWVKVGKYRWWPGFIMFPNEIPDGVKNKSHNRGEFVVKFYGTYDHYWVGRGRSFLFQEGDKGQSNSVKKRVDTAFMKAIDEATIAHQRKKEFKNSKIAQKNEKPPPYIRIKINKPVGNVRVFDGNTSNTTSCDCDPNDLFPCGPDSDCLNRLLLTECNPEVCRAGRNCHNQCFEKRQYPLLMPYKTGGRGWGLKTLTLLRKGQFIIEYVGEMINEVEYQRRVKKMHEQKEENYYFLTIDKDRMLDAGPKGNVARFMNHSCQPNCETQKWTVNGDTRVGLFAKFDIPAETELTFNYNLECIGKEMKICHCGAENCSGFIGIKAKSDDLVQKAAKVKKPKKASLVNNNNVDGNCFICHCNNDCFPCNHKQCNKFYHLKCVNFEWTEKWTCPWHSCKFCTKRTIRCCFKCINSYCPAHAKGNIRYDKLLGFVCTQHDPEAKETSQKADDNETTKPVTSTPLKNSNNTELPFVVEDCPKKGTKRKRGRPPKRKSVKRMRLCESEIQNTAHLFSTNEIPAKYLRTTRKNSENFTEKDLPIRKRTRLRYENTL